MGTGGAGELARQVGARIRRLRGERYAEPMTQAELASAVGLSVPYLSMIERGERCATVETLADLAAALDVPLPELFRREEEPPGPAPALRRLSDLVSSQGLRPAEVERLLTVARAMLG